MAAPLLRGRTAKSLSLGKHFSSQRVLTTRRAGQEGGLNEKLLLLLLLLLRVRLTGDYCCYRLMRLFSRLVHVWRWIEREAERAKNGTVGFFGVLDEHVHIIPHKSMFDVHCRDGYVQVPGLAPDDINKRPSMMPGRCPRERTRSLYISFHHLLDAHGAYYKPSWLMSASHISRVPPDIYPNAQPTTEKGKKKNSEKIV